jgi:hypothetical protein
VRLRRDVEMRGSMEEEAGAVITTGAVRVEVAVDGQMITEVELVMYVITAALVKAP